ncbi:MAG: TetR/AcrR family transcriptional regulator [Hyphomicrobium sp.]
MLKTLRRRGQRGLAEADMVEAALAEIERGGLDGFSLRCAARAIGCDVAALSYRFGSKDGLERAIAERLHAGVIPPDDKLAWDARLAGMAQHYRRAALAHPKAFPLLMRFWTSGPRDIAIADHWHRALADAGIPEAQIPATGCATYAAILGLCAAETSGLLGVPTRDAIAAIERTQDVALTKRLLPVFEKLRPDAVFDTALEILLSGLKATYAKRSARRSGGSISRSRKRKR